MSDHLPESFSLASILAEQCMCHQEGLWVRWLVKEKPETNPIIIKPKTVSHMTEQVSWVSSPCCSLPGCPFPIKSLALSACVSPQTIHFQVLDKSPLLGLPATTLWMPHSMPLWAQFFHPCVKSYLRFLRLFTALTRWGLSCLNLSLEEHSSLP